jgi:hypothetical protein
VDLNYQRREHQKQVWENGLQVPNLCEQWPVENFIHTHNIKATNKKTNKGEVFWS